MDPWFDLGSSLMIRTQIILYIFFFTSRRRHTRYWRDWSSDVCSSDLIRHTEVVPLQQRQDDIVNKVRTKFNLEISILDRKSVVSGKSVDLGGRRIIKKKKKKNTQDKERSSEKCNEAVPTAEEAQ